MVAMLNAQFAFTNAIKNLEIPSWTISSLTTAAIAMGIYYDKASPTFPPQLSRKPRL